MAHVQRPHWKPRLRIALDPGETRRGIVRSYEQLVGPRFDCPLCAMASCSIVRHQLSYRYECRNRLACGWRMRIPLREVHPLLVSLGAPTEGLPCAHLMEAVGATERRPGGPRREAPLRSRPG